VLARGGYPPGVPCWVDTTQPSPDAAARFYGRVFGWEFEDRSTAGSPDPYLVAKLDGLDVAGVGSQTQAGAPSSWATYIAVEGADAVAAAASVAGGHVIGGPFDIPDAGRMAVLADPTGAVFCLWQAREHHGAQLVNAAGSWNWSDLHTSDPERAAAFYGALFGWQTRSVDFGGGTTATMWTLPGYGRALEALDPDIRNRHAEAGVPEGFTDAVAWLLHDDGPAHWHVTFSVDDTDAVVDRAAQLGGTVVTPPFDAGPTRVATLSDPAGATFSVSRYDPTA
jgi:predicted enzyme related to lactoylglutathione lyase